MGRIRRTVALGVLAACSVGSAAGAQVPLPPPPALPPVDVPAEVAPFLAVTGPTVGPVCGTASLLTLLAPSIAEGFFAIPVTALIDRDTLRAYAGTALHVCGFVPFPLTPSQCEADRQIIDALRGLNPLAAQVVGLFPQGATVDTVLALEQLLPTGPSVAGQLADELSALMACTRSAGPPPTPPPVDRAGPAPVEAAPVPTLPLRLGSASPNRPSTTIAAPALVAPVATPAAVDLPTVFETRYVPRDGVQWLALLLGGLLLAGSAAGWRLARSRPD